MKPDEKDNARGRGPRRGPDDRHRQSDPPPAAQTEVEGWLAGRLPAQWFTAAADVVIDRDEITVIGRLSLDDIPAGVDSAAAEAGRIKRFREETRDARIAIAQEAEARYGRSIAWGAAAGESQQLFANLAVPAMTRLRGALERALEAARVGCREDADPDASLTDDIARLLGQPWDDELEPFRIAGEGSPVRWLHRVVS